MTPPAVYEPWDRKPRQPEHLGEPAPQVEFTGKGYPLRLRTICACLMLGLALGLVLVRLAYWLSGVIA